MNFLNKYWCLKSFYVEMFVVLFQTLTTQSSVIVTKCKCSNPEKKSPVFMFSPYAKLHGSKGLQHPSATAKRLTLRNLILYITTQHFQQNTCFCCSLWRCDLYGCHSWWKQREQPHQLHLSREAEVKKRSAGGCRLGGQNRQTRKKRSAGYMLPRQPILTRTVSAAKNPSVHNWSKSSTNCKPALRSPSN